MTAGTCCPFAAQAPTPYLKAATLLGHSLLRCGLLHVTSVVTLCKSVLEAVVEAQAVHDPELSNQHRHSPHGPALRYALTVFVAVRVILTIFAALMALLLPDPSPRDQLEDPSSGSSAVPVDLEAILLEPWQRFDALWYLGIAEEGYGYDAYWGATAYPPLYPALIRSVGWVLGGNYSVAAILISNVAAFVALYLLFRLVESELGRSAAKRATLYLAVSPVSFFLFAGYSESLFLALSIAALYYVRQGHWARAGLMALFASWARMSGWVLAIPFLFEYFYPMEGRRPPRTALLSIAAAPLGLVLFVLFRELAGFPPLAVLYEAYWRLQVVWPWQSVLEASRRILAGVYHIADLFDLFSTFAFVGLAVVGWRKIPTLYSLYLATGILYPLTRLKVPVHPLQSQSRYLLVLFPAFMILAQLGERPWVNRVIFYSSVALLLFWTGQFVIGGWVA